MRRRLCIPAMLMALACAPSGDIAPKPDTATVDNATPDTATPDTLAPESAAPSSGYRAGGNEPFWTLTFTPSEMRFADMGMADSAAVARPAALATQGGWRFEATANGSPFIAVIERRNCNDSMSGRPFPHTVTVTVNGRTYTGCGGDTSAMISGEAWTVVELEGTATAQRRPTITFGSDSTVTGNGGCNSFRGPYRITGEGTDIGPVAATKMACAEPVLNQQESKFFGLLDQVTRFDVVDGRLELYAGDRRVVTAER
ncbi:MAG TPA: META domain-containing protein [Longimicrobiales bacterium]